MSVRRIVFRIDAWFSWMAFLLGLVLGIWFGFGKAEENVIDQCTALGHWEAHSRPASIWCQFVWGSDERP